MTVRLLFVEACLIVMLGAVKTLRYLDELAVLVGL